MRTAGLAFLAAGLLCGDAASGAQSSFDNYRRVAPLELVPYSELTQVPPNGCVWDNFIYSNGAVIVRGDRLTTYFRCEGGTWTVTSAGDAIFGPRAPETPGSAQPTRP